MVNKQMSEKGSQEYAKDCSISDDLTLEHEESSGSVVGGGDAVSDIQRQFLFAAEKCSKDVETVTSQERALLMDIKETLPNESRKALSLVKKSMQAMHSRFAEELDANLNEVTAVLTRIERVHEEIQELRQWQGQTGGDVGVMEDVLNEKKELIEGLIENTISELNGKRQRDEQLFSQFAENVLRQVSHSVESLEQCVLRSAKRRKTRMDIRVMELNKVLIELKKFI